MLNRLPLLLICAILMASLNYATTCGTAPVGVTACLPINVINPNGATTSGFTQELNNTPFNALVGNFLVYNTISGGLVPAWVESSSLIWVQFGANTLPTGAGVNGIYAIGFCASCNYFIRGNDIGLNPTLSQYYAQYDNGRSVFSYYDNFVGTSLNASWGGAQSFQAGTGSTTVSNGVTLGVFGGWWGYTSSTVGGAVTNQIIESYMSFTSLAGGGACLGQYNGAGSCEATAVAVGGATIQNMGSGVPSSNWGSTGSGFNSGTLYLIGYSNSGSTQLLQQNYATIITSSHSVNSDSNLLLDEAGGISAFYQWYRARQLPPGGAMPFINYGAITPYVPPTPPSLILILTNNPLNFGYIEQISGYITNSDDIELTINGITEVSATNNAFTYNFFTFAPPAIGAYVINTIDPTGGYSNAITLNVVPQNVVNTNTIEQFGVPIYNIDALLPLLAGILFCILYVVERDNKEMFVFKWLWLFAGVAFIGGSAFLNYQLTASTYNSITGVTSYTYGVDTVLDPFGLVMGTFGIVIAVLFLYKAVLGVIGSQTEGKNE